MTEADWVILVLCAVSLLWSAHTWWVTEKQWRELKRKWRQELERDGRR